MTIIGRTSLWLAEPLTNRMARRATIAIR